MSGTFSTLTPCGQGVVSPAGVIHWCGVPSLIHGVMPPCRCRVARLSLKQLVASFGYSRAHRVADLVHDGAVVHRRPTWPCGPMPEPIRVVSTGRNRSPSGAGRQQVAEDDPHRLVLGRGDDRAEVLRRGHAAVARVDRDVRSVQQRVRQSGTAPAVVAGLELHVAADQRSPGARDQVFRDDEKLVRYCTRPISYSSASMPL